jgi:hypothetical protein
MNTARCDDLNDDLSDLLGGNVPLREKPVTPPPSYTPPETRFEEPCPKCRGTGQFIGRNGYALGQCFACKGAGKNIFRTSPEARAKNRATSNARKATREAEQRAERTAQAEAFKVARPDVWAWLQKTSPRFEFAASMTSALTTYGSLTANQLAAVGRCMAKDAEREQERKMREAAAPTVDVNKIEKAFATARAKAAKGRDNVAFLRLRLGAFTFSDMPATERFEAAIMVKSVEGTKLARIAGGKLHCRRECSDEQQAAILAAIADPFAAAKAYGYLWKSCACCGRELTNERSRKLGIGPVCAEKYGWLADGDVEDGDQ